MLESGKLNDELGMIIIDEIHMIIEEERGYLLELLLTKLIYNKSKIQIVCMSATIPNVDKLGDWLNAHVFITDWRPIHLDVYQKLN
jgi:DNA polymerase theta